jgi:hypothetical protein
MKTLGGCAAFLAAVLVAMPAAASAATPPDNDAVTAPATVDATRGSTLGTTDGATLAKTDPTSVCSDAPAATVWYSLANVPARDTVLRLQAFDGLTAALVVYHVRNGRLTQVDCAETGDDGIATLGVSAQNGDLVLVAQLASSGPGTFALATLVPEQREPLPGRALHGTATASVEALLDESDLWHVDLRPGTSYRISFVTRGTYGCAHVTLFRVGSRPLLQLRCNSATSFTPGPDGGGRYLLLVDIGYADGRVPYRLELARANRDDTAPGLKLPVGVWRDGTLEPGGVDQLDMYRFTLSARSDITVELGRPSARNVSLLLVRENGKSIAAGRAVRRPLAPGTYFAIVNAPAGTERAAYRVRLRVRAQSILAAVGVERGHAALGTPVVLAAAIGKPFGRVASLEIDRFDPLNGWLYARTYRLPVAPDGTASLHWRPPTAGMYRARIVAPSRSRYRFVTVDDVSAGP